MIIIIVIVIAILASVLILTFSGIVNDAKESAAMQEARNAYAAYLADNAGTGNVVDDLYVEVEDGVVTLTSEKYLTVNASGKVLYNTGKVAADGKNYKIKYTKIFKINI